MAEIIDGKAVAAKITEEIKQKVQTLAKKPALAVILVGSDAASEIYVKNKEKKAKEIGFNSKTYRLDENTSENELRDLIISLNEDEDVSGILLQLPLPKHLNSKDFIELIDPKKDVDGFHPINMGKLLTNSSPNAVSCTPKGVMRLLEEYNISLEGKLAVVIGRSNMVGKPLSVLLGQKNATVICAHSKTKDLEKITSQADIILSATGKSGLIKKNFVKSGAVVIDIGISRDKDGKISGDVDFSDVEPIASYITPVPGGVGPMTIAMLMENTLELYLKNAKL